MSYILKSIFVFLFFSILGILFRDIWKFFRIGFGGKIPIYPNQSTLDSKYHIESDTLFKEFIDFDQNGVAISHYAKGLFYNPAYVAWQGLCALKNYYDSQDKRYLKTIQNHVSWLKGNSIRDGQRGNVWHYEFDWREGNSVLKKPWISGMAQGLIISLLVRTYRITGDRDLLNMAKRAARVYEISVDDGGIRLSENSFVFYEEYPVEGGVKILDGFIFALLGLYDLFEATKNEKYLTMFKEGLDTLEKNMVYWDYRNKWSRYGRHRFLCTPTYNKLNSQLLQVLYSITGRDTFLQYSSAWNAGALSLDKKLEILVAFLTTRNIKRIVNAVSHFRVHRN